ncbi:predicted protein [Nematostella vectensis]|uniref:VPS9 domain-containing protein n=1 Tax=Nematostella vectensis TaxID=45351 RepID=A7SUI7_NEMVE|nr:uncharacterized protein LOC5503795 [Nematostella vectensis]EDO32657.1 predicted protein [Nematostella vectensis]|eukprot:XP_001624757.1 predicted protein [Nematostella vectensis]
MAYSLPIPGKPLSRSFREVAEHSKLLDWELDSIKTEQDETVGRSLFYFRNLKTELRNQCENASSQQEKLDIQTTAEEASVWVMGSWGALESVDWRREEAKDYANRKSELVKQILSFKIHVLCLKLSRVSAVIRELQELESANGAKFQTPPSLQQHKFEDWVQSNEQIFQLQSKILDLEARKVRLHKGYLSKKERRPSISSITTKESFASVLDTHPGREADTEFMHRFIDEVVISEAPPTSSDSALDRLLSITSQNMSFEACKLKAYVRECWEVDNIDDNFPTGVHPDRYQEVVGGMCQYVVDKHSSYGALPYDAIYAKIEHHLIPVIYNRIRLYTSKPEDDSKIQKLSSDHSQITQTDIGIKPCYQDVGLAPFYPAIAALKSMSLSMTPTRKIYNVVKAAKLVFEKLNELAARDSRQQPGADEFMDVWVYVVLKANVPHLISTITYLKQYSNPNLGFTEAGYYLASIEFACQYILRLRETDLCSKQLTGKEDLLVVCERARYLTMAAGEDPLVEVVAEEAWLSGYELYAVKEWQLDQTRFRTAILIPSAESTAKVSISTVRLNTRTLSPIQLKTLEESFLHPQGLDGLSCISTPCGQALVLDPNNVNRRVTLIRIPDGKYDDYEEDIKWYCTLERLSCLCSTLTEHRSYNPSSSVECFEGEVSRTASSNSNEHCVVDPDIVSKAAKRRDDLVTEYYGGRCGIEMRQWTISSFMVVLVTLLRNLGYLSPLLDITKPFYSNLVLLSVHRFQMDHNELLNKESSRNQALSTSGYLCPGTWDGLIDLMNTQLSKLKRLGFEYDGNPFASDNREQANFRRFVRHCQESLAIEMHNRGTLERHTRDEIDRLILDM